MTEQEFVNYCLRKLGHGVITVNVTREQVLDRINEAYEQFVEKHYDSIEGEWLAHLVTEQDILNGYITLPDDIKIVDGLLPYNTVQTLVAENGTQEEMKQFSYQWQLVNAALGSLTFAPVQMLSYFMWKLQINTMQDLFGMMPRFEYTLHKRKLVVYNGEVMKLGQAAMIHVKRKVPKEECYENPWFKRFATAKIKEQWGSNLKKHSNMNHLGGVQVNGQQIYDEATHEIEQLKQELIEQYEVPPMFIVG